MNVRVSFTNVLSHPPRQLAKSCRVKSTIAMGHKRQASANKPATVVTPIDSFVVPLVIATDVLK